MANPFLQVTQTARGSQGLRSSTSSFPPRRLARTAPRHLQTRQCVFPAPHIHPPLSLCIMDALSSLCFTASASSLCNYPSDEQQQPVPEPTPVSKPKANSTVTILSSPSTNSPKAGKAPASSSCPAEAPVSPSTPDNDGYNSPKTKENQAQTQDMPSPSPIRASGKRKRLNLEDDELTSFITPTPSKRKASSDYLRKGQWTSTEERLARLLIEAFEEGYLPIYTGIRLRGYLAVQLQCDPMRVSKKLCAGTIDGKQVPKNYGQKKFKLRKKSLWDSDEVACRIADLQRLTRAMWTEARMRKPSFLTLSSTRNLTKRRGSDDDDDSLSSSPSPARGRSPSSTPRSKKQKVFPIIYLNLSRLKRYSGRGDSSDSEPASKYSDSDSEPVRLDGESLQAAYDLLTLCSPRGTSTKGKSKKSKKDAAKKVAPAEETAKDAVESCEDKIRVDDSIMDIRIKDELWEPHGEGIPSEDKANEGKSNPNASITDCPGEDAMEMEDTPIKETLEVCDVISTDTTSGGNDEVSIKSEPSSGIWFFAHVTGWWGKMCMFRDWRFCWVLSIAFEILELALQFVIPDFQECWWDSLLLDLLGANMLGMCLGRVTLWLLQSKEYDWSGRRGKKMGYFRLALNQFTPFSWEQYHWEVFSSFKRFAEIFFAIVMCLLTELNAFFMLTTLSIPKESNFNSFRLLLVFLLGIPAAAENSWMLLSIATFEVLVWVKFSANGVLFTQPPPPMVLYPILAFVIMFSIWMLLFFRTAPQPTSRRARGLVTGWGYLDVLFWASFTPLVFLSSQWAF
ncbi:Phosphatidyl serine synthase [Phytophthora cactorum]|nr:Phosphatidyl serine synthase [Phytophthora cactorum]